MAKCPVCGMDGEKVNADMEELLSLLGKVDRMKDNLREEKYQLESDNSALKTALEGCLQAMEMQVGRMNESLFISEKTATDIWERAYNSGRKISPKAPCPQWINGKRVR